MCPLSLSSLGELGEPINKKKRNKGILETYIPYGRWVHTRSKTYIQQHKKLKNKKKEHTHINFI
jgi:hypothetical protein